MSHKLPQKGGAYDAKGKKLEGTKPRGHTLYRNDPKNPKNPANQAEKSASSAAAKSGQADGKSGNK